MLDLDDLLKQWWRDLGMKVGELLLALDLLEYSS